MWTQPKWKNCWVILVGTGNNWPGSLWPSYFNWKLRNSRNWPAGCSEVHLRRKTVWKILLPSSIARPRFIAPTTRCQTWWSICIQSWALMQRPVGAHKFCRPRVTCKQSTPRKGLQQECKHTEVCSPHSTRCFPAQKPYRNQDNCFLESPTVFFVQTVWEMERCYACSSIIIMQDRFMLQGSKPAGVGAQQTASAAAAYLLQDFESNWSHIDLCWIGDFSVINTPSTVLDCLFRLCHFGSPHCFYTALTWSWGATVHVWRYTQGQFQLWAIYIYFERPIWDTLTLSEEVCSFPGAFTTTASTTCMCSALVSGNGATVGCPLRKETMDGKDSGQNKRLQYCAFFPYQQEFSKVLE